MRNTKWTEGTKEILQQFVTQVFLFRAIKKVKSKACVRHKIVNGRLCSFKIVQDIYRHKLKRKPFLAFVIIKNLLFDCSKIHFQLKY